MIKIKEITLWILGFFSTVLGFLWYYLSLKNKEINKLKTKVTLVETEKEADLIEIDIKEIRDEKKRLKKEYQEIDKTLVSLDKKRQEIKFSVNNMTDDEIIDYWNK